MQVLDMAYALRVMLPPTFCCAARTRITPAADLGALRHPTYWLSFFGEGVWLIGTWMQTMARRCWCIAGPVWLRRWGDQRHRLRPADPVGASGPARSPTAAPKRTIILIAQTVMMIQASSSPRWPGPARFRLQVYALAFALAVAQAVDLPAGRPLPSNWSRARRI